MAEVKLHGSWGSPFSRRVEIALKLKGVEYEYVEENLQNKSEQLLKFNPIHKKIPVLVHNGKVIVESSVILEYIDETWKENPLLPTDPYDRAQARFWSMFIDDMLMSPSARKALTSPGEESEDGKKEVKRFLECLENEIKGKKFFGGNEIGFVDIMALFVAYWMPILQELVGKEFLTREEYPGICAWADELLNCDIIKENLPEKEKLIAFFKVRFAPA